jgi:hypothetical protein
VVGSSGVEVMGALDKDEPRVGVQLDLVGLGAGVMTLHRLGCIAAGVDDSLDDLMSKVRQAIEPHWNDMRALAALNAERPNCSDSLSGSPCYFWRTQPGGLCENCSSYRDLVDRIRDGGKRVEAQAG